MFTQEATSRPTGTTAKWKYDAVGSPQECLRSPRGCQAPAAAAQAIAEAGDSAMFTMKGRRVVLCDMTYRIDVATLEDHAETPEAKSTRASCDESEHELIRKFLDSGRVKRLPDGTGVCTFSYAASDIGEELFRHGSLENGGRLYPDKWPSATCLPRKLRNCALGALHVEMDDSNAFHRYLQCLTNSTMARAVLEDLVQDNSYRSCLAEHYFGDRTKTEPVKVLFHMLANDGLCKDWRREHKIKRDIPDHPKVEQMEAAMKEVAKELASTDLGRRAVAFIKEKFPKKWKPRSVDGKSKLVQVDRDPKLTWKSYLLQ